MKKHPVVKYLLMDVLCAGVALVIFALFHHVLPRQGQSLAISIPNPYAAQAETEASAKTDGADDSVAASVRSEGKKPSDPSAAAADEAEASSVSAVSSATVADSSGTRNSSEAPSEGAQSGEKSVSSESGRNRSAGKGRTAFSPDPDTLTASASGQAAGRSGKKSGRSGTGSRGGMNSKGGSALTEGEGTAASADAAPISEKFADKYTDTVVETDSSYSSPNVSVTVTEKTLDGGRITCHLADIYLRDVTAFRTALAGDTYGSGYRDSISRMAALSEALLAVNGDYYGNTSEGVVIRNGIVYRANPTSCDVCVLYYDGSMRVMNGADFDVEEAVADGAWQAWTFGPALLDGDGNAISSFSSTGRIISANPRTAIGYYEPGHYCLITVDGRGESAGITLPELSSLFEELGCAAAYNLDGGNSSVMVWQGEVINDPSGGGRESSDAVLIAEVN